MQGQWLFDIWRGYVTIEVKNGDIPHLLNVARIEQIPLWNIRYKSSGTVSFFTYVKDFKRLRGPIRQSRCKMHVHRRYGFPFLLDRWIRRKAFTAGFAVFISSLFLLQSFVWSVHVSGTDKTSPESVQAALRTLGIYRGSWKPNPLLFNQYQLKMLDLLPQFSWVGIQLNGTNIQVQVVEKTKGPVYVAKGPQQVIATKSGTITEVLVHKGKAEVKKGQTVNPGDVLITGNIGASQPVPADGIVKANVWYTSKVELPLQVNAGVYTGEKVKRDFLIFGQLPIQVWGYGQLPFQTYEEISHDVEWSIAGWKLPIPFRTIDSQEV